MSMQDGPSRETLLRGVAVILRVPSLFIADVWSRTDPETVHAKWIMVFTKDNKLVKETHLRHLVILTQILYYSMLGFVLSLILLPLQKLVRLYAVIVSAVLLLIANFLSSHFVHEAASRITVSSFTATDFNVDSIQHFFIYMMLQYMISELVTRLLGFGGHARARMILLVYSLPLIASLFRMRAEELQRVHHASATFMLLLSALFLFNQLPVAIETVKNGLQHASSAIQLSGWLHFLTSAWIEMLLPLQFFLFWTILFSSQLYQYAATDAHPVWKEGWPVVLLASMSESCCSPLSFLGACVTVTYLSKAVLWIVIIYLGHHARDHQHNEGGPTGLAEGVTMFILGIQTGLIELKSADRIFLLSIVLFIVLSSLIQSMFEITDPVLLSLAASQNKNVSKHVRAVALSSFLWIVPITMTSWICQMFELDFWLLVVISSCLLTSVQVLGALFVYALMIFDSLCGISAENLDDIIYCVKCLTRILEFFVAVFVVSYGIEKSLVGTWNWLNSSILIVHCYYNVWQRLQSGWTTYLQRRTAIKRMSLMKDATSKELQDLDDVCSICYQDMQSAKITPCRHMFHAVCLKKWLFIQDYCPICHEKILDVLANDQPHVQPENLATQLPTGLVEGNRTSAERLHSLSGRVDDSVVKTLDTALLSDAFAAESHANLPSLHQIQGSMPEKLQSGGYFTPVSIIAECEVSKFQRQTSETGGSGTSSGSFSSN